MRRRKNEKILQAEQNLETMRKMLEEQRSSNDKYPLKQILLEQLDIARKIAQIHPISSDTDKYRSASEVYFKMFGKDITEKLEWNNLYPVIDNLYDGFVGKLRKKFPDLSEKYIQLCCLLRADFDTREITAMLGYNNDISTRTQKNRLRKVMGFLSLEKLLLSLKNI